MSPSKAIKELQPGEQVVDAVYLLAEKQVRTTRNGQPYLSARLRDESGQIEGRLWDLPPGVAEQLQEGHGVQVSGEVTSYKGQIQLRIDSIQAHSIDSRGFLPSSTRSPVEMEAELRDCIRGISDPWLRQLLERIFIRDAAFLARFIEAPAAKFYHHACLGGLIEHTLGVAALVLAIAPRYPQLPQDLLLTLALLHDLGKVEAYEWEANLGQSDQGRLLEHVYLGARRVERVIDEIAGFPEELRRRILHALLAHHGEETAGSPVRPKTLEAVVLHLLDMLDAHIRGFQDHLDRQQDQEAAWTEWSKMFEARLYRGGTRGRPS